MLRQSAIEAFSASDTESVGGLIKSCTVFGRVRFPRGNDLEVTGSMLPLADFIGSPAGKGAIMQVRDGRIVKPTHSSLGWIVGPRQRLYFHTGIVERPIEIHQWGVCCHLTTNCHGLMSHGAYQFFWIWFTRWHNCKQSDDANYNISSPHRLLSYSQSLLTR